MRVLYIHFQPKDLPEVLEPLEKINCDKLYLRYVKYPDVHKIAMDTIKKHPEYSHIFWSSGDAVIIKEDFERLYRIVEKNNYSVLGMACNVDLTKKGMGWIAASFKKIPLGFENVDWIEKNEVKGIIQVQYSGCPMLIKREILVKYPLLGEKRTGFNTDLIFCHHLLENKIPILVDTSFNILHLRFKGEMQVGKKAPEIQFIPCILNR